MFINNFRNIISKYKRKEISKEQLISQSLVADFTKEKSINGLTFLERRILIKYIPEIVEIEKFHKNLCERVNEFIETVQGKVNLVPIEKRKITFCKNCYATKIFTYLNSTVPPAYLVQGVVFLYKREDGKWIIIEKNRNGFEERIQIFDNYPENLTFSYCGGFGDVNYITQEDFTYFNEIFFEVNGEYSKKLLIEYDDSVI